MSDDKSVSSRAIYLRAKALLGRVKFGTDSLVSMKGLSRNSQVEILPAGLVSVFLGKRKFME